MATPTVTRPSRLGWVSITAGVVSVVVVGVAGLLLGAAGLAPSQVVRALLDVLPLVEVDHGLSEIQLNVLFQIRAPRVVLGGMVGAILAVGGASYQGVFRNPLADPYLLGVAAGAGLGATVAFAVSGDANLLAPFAFVGGMSAVAVTYSLGRSVGGRTTTSLILAGVAVAAFATAIQTFILQRNSETLRQVYSWILGQLVTVGWSDVFGLLPYAMVAAGVMLASRRILDVLSIGDEEAAALGVNVVRFRWVVVLAATLGMLHSTLGQIFEIVPKFRCVPFPTILDNQRLKDGP